jgi:hypothetical protein
MSAGRIDITGVPVDAQRVRLRRGAGLGALCSERTSPQGLGCAAGRRPPGRDRSRGEKGYRYWSTDVTPAQNPYEAGQGFCVRLQKSDFIGRDALLHSVQEHRVTAIPTTPSQLAEAQALLDRLIAEHSPGHALQREFQTAPGSTGSSSSASGAAVGSSLATRIRSSTRAIILSLTSTPTPSSSSAAIRYTEWYLHAIARPEHPEGSVARRICASHFPPAR